jgi:capsular polysaccharide biosynthesis protein
MVEKLHLQTWSAAPSLDVAWQNWTGFVALAPGESALAPKLRLAPGSDVQTGPFIEEHAFVGPIEPIGCHFLNDIVHSGLLYPFQNGALVDDGSHLSMVSALWLQNHPPHHPGGRAEVRRRVITEPVIAVAGPGHQTYGHWIIDFLPRLAIAQAVLGERFRTFKFLLLSDTPAWALTLLQHFFGITQADCIGFHADTDEYRCERVCYPTYAHTYPFLLHSFLHTFFRSFDHRSAPRRRLCVVRRLPGQDPRPFAGRDAFEDMALREGYELVDPQGMGVTEQAALFGAAAVVIGEYGSALHNSVFSPAETVFGVLNAPGVEQTRLCAAFQQPIVYMPTLVKDGPWSLSDSQLRSFFRTVEQAVAEAGTGSAAVMPAEAAGPPNAWYDIDPIRTGTPKSGIAFTALAAGAALVPPAPAFMLGPIPQAATHEMCSRYTAGPVGYFTVRNARVTQDGIVIHHHTALTGTATNHPLAHCQMMVSALDPALWRRPPVRVAGQGVLLFGPGWPSWGHWLVDFLPRLHLLTIAGYDVTRLRWIIPAKTPSFARALLAAIGSPQAALLEFEPTQEVLQFDEVVMPTNMHGGALMHPRFGDAVRWLRTRLNISQPERGGSRRKIFVSRRKAYPHHRVLLNRDRIEELAGTFGYTIIIPEDLSALEQIAVFENATHIIGEYGSGLHTAVFSPPGTVVTCLRGTAHTAGVLQNGLAKVCDHTIGYIFGESIPGDPRQAYRIDEQAFALGMDCADRPRQMGGFEILERSTI